MAAKCSLSAAGARAGAQARGTSQQNRRLTLVGAFLWGLDWLPTWGALAVSADFSAARKAVPVSSQQIQSWKTKP